MLQVIEALLLSGLMGMLGQAIRAVIGLKGLADQAADPNNPNPEIFSAARLAVSLVIGFVAGAASGLTIGLSAVSAVSLSNTSVLMTLLAAGYAGTDAIEGFMASYLPGNNSRPAAPPLPAAAPQAVMLAAPAPTAGDAKVRAACEASWEANKANCSGFVEAVGGLLGATISGNANDIVQAMLAGAPWQRLADGVAAAQAAHNGKFVVGGLAGASQAVPDAHGHVVVVVDGQPLNRGKYPYAYWGSLGGTPAKDQTVNWAWTPADRDKVIYAAYEP